MSFFARKIKYAATPISFSALIEIAREANGNPEKFVLYFHDGQKDFFGMLLFEDRETANENFPFGPGGFWNRQKTRWATTSDWLFDVAAGGSYQKHSTETWVEIQPPQEEIQRLQKRA